MTKRTLVDEASDPETPFHRLLQLSQDVAVEVRRSLVDNPSIAVDESGAVRNEILLNLAFIFPDEVARSPAFALFGLELKDPAMVAVTYSVAWNAKDPQVLTLLLQEFQQEEDVRRGVAFNKNTPDDVLRLLGNVKTEPHGEVRRYVTKNPNAPEDVIRILGNMDTEPDEWVRRGVAMNPNAPADVLRILGNVKTEPDELVRRNVAENPSAPEDVLKILESAETEPAKWLREYAHNARKRLQK